MKKGENRHRLLPFPFEIWSGRRVSNSRPQPWQGCALPTELLPHLWRREAESNRRERICNPVHSHFAIAPFSWSGRRVSNSRPQPWQGCALPTELLPQLRRRIIRGFLELSRARNQKVYFFRVPFSTRSNSTDVSADRPTPFPLRLVQLSDAPRSRRCALPQSTSNGICTADASRDGRQRKCRRDTSIRTFERRAGRHQAAKNKSPRSEDRGLAIDSHDRSQRPIDASSLVR